MTDETKKGRMNYGPALLQTMLVAVDLVVMATAAIRGDVRTVVVAALAAVVSAAFAGYSLGAADDRTAIHQDAR